MTAPQGQPGVGAEADLVKDLAGLLFGRRVDVRALEPGQGLQHTEREVGSAIRLIHPVMSESRPNRVMNQGAPAAIDRELWMIRVEDAQRAEVIPRPRPPPT